MTEYLVPAGFGQGEYTEKRSRFIGQLWPVESEAEALAHLAAVRKAHYDARHNCFAYIVRDGGVVRYGDDGEPQGTAGQPILAVLSGAELTNVCCTVTRYFGGVLLGTGGLLRAYTKSTADALEAAGISAVRRWVETELPCSYAQMERLKLEAQSAGGIVADIEYGAGVTLKVLVPGEQSDAFAARIFDQTAGSVQVRVTGESFRAVPVR